MSDNSDNKEILPITSARFAAALYVFLFHVHIRWPLAEHGTPADQMLNHGAVGMSLFFVLSGFVMGFRFHNGIGDWRRYVVSRVARIYPVYVLAALVTLPWLVMPVLELDGHALRKVVQLGFIVAADIAMIQAWMPQLFEFWNNGASWSISVEAFFYALLPLTLLLVAPLHRRRYWLLFLAFYCMATLPGISAILFPDRHSFVIFYSIPIFRLGEFLCGLAAGLLFARGVTIPRPGWVALSAVAGLTTYLSSGPNFGFTFMTDNFVVVPLILITLWALASLKGAPARALSNPVTVYLGRQSYSFYSFQALVGLIILAQHDAMVAAVPALNNNWILAAVSYTALVGIAAVSYELVEVRFRSRLLRRSKAQRPQLRAV